MKVSTHLLELSNQFCLYSLEFSNKISLYSLEFSKSTRSDFQTKFHSTPHLPVALCRASTDKVLPSTAPRICAYPCQQASF